MQLRVYLIRNQALHVINRHMHSVVTILSGKQVDILISKNQAQ